MKFFMTLKSFLRGEQSTASNAFEEFVDRIDVPTTVMRASEGRRTDGTLVWFVQGMCAAMFLEVTGLLKPFVANITNIWTFS